MTMVSGTWDSRASNPLEDIQAFSESLRRAAPGQAWVTDADVRLLLRVHLDETGRKTPRSLLCVIDGGTARPVRDISEAIHVFGGEPAFWQNVLDWGEV